MQDLAPLKHLIILQLQKLEAVLVIQFTYSSELLWIIHDNTYNDNDRISVKSAVNGTVGASAAYTFVLSNSPASNPVYHVPQLILFENISK